MEMISIDKLYPHPQNPRREVGDVSELAESIRTNGVYQNLTVIEGGAGVPEGEDGYTVIIGHRRLAAAKAAGLAELPCAVAEMDERQQVATMLLENMQRTDLTVYEQAQGFQMMLDLGETQASIAEKTGFSRSTVKHRIKLLELDQKEFEKSQERGASLADYIELEKITDAKDKLDALKKIGTPNFRWAVENAVNKQNAKKHKEEWLKFIEGTGLPKVGEKQVSKKEKVCGYGFYLRNAITKKQKEEINKAVKEGKAKCYAHDDYYLYILGENKPKETEPEWEVKDRERKARIDRIREIEGRARKLRFDFVKTYSGKASHTGRLVDELIFQCPTIGRTNWKRVAELCRINIDEDDCGKLRQSPDYEQMILKQPELLLLALLTDVCENGRFELHDYNGRYMRNECLEHRYELLEELGYRLSDDEKKLLDGTHECFGEDN